jgi:hypothetical protein
MDEVGEQNQVRAKEMKVPAPATSSSGGQENVTYSSPPRGDVEVVSAPKHIDKAKLGVLVAPKRPLTDLLGVKKEDGAYARMESPCQQKFKCEACEYYSECTHPSKVKKPKTDEQMIDTFFGEGWDDMTKGWERLG